jgi:hypothetical protein
MTPPHTLVRRRRLAKKMRNPCVPTSFTQSTCAASYDLPDRPSRAIPMCDAAESVLPCYRLVLVLVADPVLCPGDNLLVRLESSDTAERVPAGTWLAFTCW